MASNDPRLPSQYPIHWKACMEWLASRREGEIDITLDAVYTLGTQHNKAKGMRESIRRHVNWPYNVKVMVEEGELHFERRGKRLWAVRRPHVRSLGEILQDLEG